MGGRLRVLAPLAVALGGLLLGPLVTVPLVGREVILDGADVTAAVLGVWAAVVVATTGRRPRWDAAALPALGVVAVAVLQVALLDGAAEIATGATRFAAVAVTALALGILLPVRPPVGWHLVVGAFGAVIAGGVLLDIAPTLVAGGSGFYDAKNTVAQPLGASNYLAAFLLVSSLATGTVAVLRRDRVAGALAAVALVGLAGTLSRGAAAALIAAVLVAALHRIDRRLGLAAGVLAAVAGVALPLLAGATSVLADVPGVSALLNRQDQFVAAWRAFVEDPVLGVGLNRYQEAVSLGLAQPHEHAHNLVLHDLAELGLLGTPIHLAIWGLLAWRIARLPAGATRAGLAVGTFALFLHAQVEALTSTQPIEVLLVVLAVVAGAAPGRGAQPATSASPTLAATGPGVRSTGDHGEPGGPS